MSRREVFGRNAAQKVDAIHRSLLSGLLGNIGKKNPEGQDYVGPRGVRFNMFPGSALIKAKPQWIMSADLVETARLYARTVAPIDPLWVEQLAPHLLSPSYGTPVWNQEGARAMVQMKLSLHGLIIVPARMVGYAKVDPKGARALFIHHALVMGEFRTDGKFLLHNLDLLEDARHLEDKARRRDLRADPARLYEFYDARIPADVWDGPRFEKWRHEAETLDPKALYMTRADTLMGDVEDITPERYPEVLVARVPSGELRFPLQYRFDPGHPADGLTARVRLPDLERVQPWMLDRLVPGYLPLKIAELIRSLPKAHRVRFVPVTDHIGPAVDAVKNSPLILTDALAKHLQVPRDSFSESELAPWLFTRVAVIDGEGRVVASGRDVAGVRKDLGVKARSTFADLPEGPWNRDNLTSWDFDELPAQVDVRLANMVLVGYPAIVARDKTVALRLFETDLAAHEAQHDGLRRLFELQIAPELKYLEKNIPQMAEMGAWFRTFGTAQQLKDDILGASCARALDNPTPLFPKPEDVRTKQEFIRIAAEGWKRLVPASTEVAKYAAAIVQTRHKIEQMMARSIPPLLMPGVRDTQEQLEHLVYAGFLTATPVSWLAQLPRFLKAAEIRVSKIFDAGAARDAANLQVIKPLWRRYLERKHAHKKAGVIDVELEKYRWMVEELRVSMFAQELKTSIPVSPVRLDKQWELVRGA